MDLQRQLSSSIESGSANTYKVEPETQIQFKQSIDFKTRLNGKIRKQIKTENKDIPNSMRVSKSCRPNDLGIQGEDLADENYETIQSQLNSREQKKKLDSTAKMEKAPSMVLDTVKINSKLVSKRGNSNKKEVLELDLNSSVGTIRIDRAYAGTIEY